MRGCRPIPETRRESGFTLIEVMVAVTILALIASMAFAVVFGAVKRSRFIDMDLDLNTEGTAILRLVAEDIRSAYATEGITPYFVGRDRFSRDLPIDGITLLTTAVLPVTPEMTTGSFGEVEYRVEEKNDGSLVLFRREETPAVAPFNEGGTLYEVTDRLGAFQLAYSDGDDWFDEWDSQSETSFSGKRLPRKVRIEITLREKDTERTFRTIVAPVMSVGR